MTRGRFSVRRLVGAARQDVYDIARARHLPDPQRFLFLAIDRLALYFPAAELVADGKPLPRLRMIDDFAVGMNLMIIRAEAAHMPPVLAGKLEQVRREVARVYERHRFERPLLAAMRPAELGDDPRGDLSGDLPGEALLVLVDDALEEAARTDVHDHEHLLEALTGLYLALADIRSLPPGDCIMKQNFLIGGVILSPLVPQVLLALMLTVILSIVLMRLGFYRLVWHRSLVELSLFCILLGLVVVLDPWGSSWLSFLPTAGLLLFLLVADPMTRLMPALGRVALTLLLLAGAGVALFVVWGHYENDPWTRDGSVEADVVQVSADVSGLVSQIRVHDNQFVHAGDVLFTIDEDRYEAQFEQAEAAVATAKANIAVARAGIVSAQAAWPARRAVRAQPWRSGSRGADQRTHRRAGPAAWAWPRQGNGFSTRPGAISTGSSRCSPASAATTTARPAWCASSPPTILPRCHPARAGRCPDQLPGDQPRTADRQCDGRHRGRAVRCRGASGRSSGLT
jgi:hypothetical protein